MTNKTYDILKWVAMVAVPAVATLIGALGVIWGVPTEQVVLTVTALNVFLSTILGITTSIYKKNLTKENTLDTLDT